MPVAVVDLLEAVHIKGNQQTTAAAPLCRSVQIAVLVQKPGERIQLVPRLVAIGKVQHRQQGNAHPGHVQIGQRHLNDSDNRQKAHKRVDQSPAPVLKRPVCDYHGRREVQKRCKVQDDINKKVPAARVDIICADGKHRTIGYGKRKKEKISDLAAYCRLEAMPGQRFFIQHIHKAKRHGRRQSKAQIVR